MITSKANPRIRNLVQLKNASGRKAQNLFIVEGYRETERALRSGYHPDSLFLCESLAHPEQTKKLITLLPSQGLIETVTEEVFEKIAYREGSDGIVALFKPVLKELNALHLPENPLVIVLESVEKPGNLGAVMRTADAAGVDALIICNPATDLYNPNTIRASLGCIFSLQIAVTTSEKAISFLKEHGISIYCTSLEASKHYLSIDYTISCAIVMGSEADGLTQDWTRQSKQNILIPMHGIADSLNVSVSSAIVVYEALRQRGK